MIVWPSGVLTLTCRVQPYLERKGIALANDKEIAGTSTIFYTTPVIAAPSTLDRQIGGRATIYTPLQSRLVV